MLQVALVAKKMLLHMDGTIHEVAGIAAEAAGAERIAGASVAEQFAQRNCLQDRGVRRESNRDHVERLR